MVEGKHTGKLRNELYKFTRWHGRGVETLLCWPALNMCSNALPLYVSSTKKHMDVWPPAGHPTYPPSFVNCIFTRWAARHRARAGTLREQTSEQLRFNIPPPDWSRTYIWPHASLDTHDLTDADKTRSPLARLCCSHLRAVPCWLIAAKRIRTTCGRIFSGVLHSFFVNDLLTLPRTPGIYITSGARKVYSAHPSTPDSPAHRRAPAISPSIVSATPLCLCEARCNFESRVESRAAKHGPPWRTADERRTGFVRGSRWRDTPDVSPVKRSNLRGPRKRTCQVGRPRCACLRA